MNAENTDRPYLLVIVRPDGTRFRSGAYASYRDAAKTFKGYADPKLRARIEDLVEDREYWLAFPELHRRRNAAKPTPPSIIITAWGETKNLLAWARDPRCHCSAQVIKSRINRETRRWTPEEAISTPPKTGLRIVELKVEQAKRYEAFGETKTITEWLDDPRCQAHPHWFRELLERGVPCEEALVGVAPPGFRRREHLITAWGETKSITEWIRDPRCRVSEWSLKQHLGKGIATELVLSGHFRSIKIEPCSER